MFITPSSITTPLSLHTCSKESDFTLFQADEPVTPSLAVQVGWLDCVQLHPEMAYDPPDELPDLSPVGSEHSMLLPPPSATALGINYDVQAMETVWEAPCEELIDGFGLGLDTEPCYIPAPPVEAPKLLAPIPVRITNAVPRLLNELAEREFEESDTPPFVMEDLGYSWQELQEYMSDSDSSLTESESEEVIQTEMPFVASPEHYLAVAEPWPRMIRRPSEVQERLRERRHARHHSVPSSSTIPSLGYRPSHWTRAPSMVTFSETRSYNYQVSNICFYRRKTHCIVGISSYASSCMDFPP